MMGFGCRSCGHDPDICQCDWCELCGDNQCSCSVTMDPADDLLIGPGFDVDAYLESERQRLELAQPDDIADLIHSQGVIKEKVEAAIAALTPREQEVFKARFEVTGVNNPDLDTHVKRLNDRLVSKLRRRVSAWQTSPLNHRKG